MWIVDVNSTVSALEREREKQFGKSSHSSVKFTKLEVRAHAGCVALTSSQTRFLLLALGRRFMILSSADLRSPSAVNSMFGLFRSPSMDTLRKYLKKLSKNIGHKRV